MFNTGLSWTFVASIVLFAANVLATSISVACARYAMRLCADSKAALSRAGTTSLRAELDEIRDAFEKNSRLLKRISSRESMNDRRGEDGTAYSRVDERKQRPGESAEAWKQRMRKMLLVAGQPAKHG